MPNTIETIKYDCFTESSLLSIDIPDSVKTIENSAFLNCPYLTSVNMSNSVEELGSSAFTFCGNLSDITLSNKLTVLRSCVFQYTGISTFTISNNITIIENGALANCSNLKSVIFEDPNNWVYNGESVNVNDSEVNAYLLSKTYNENTWYKNTVV